MTRGVLYPNGTPTTVTPLLQEEFWHRPARGCLTCQVPRVPDTVRIACEAFLGGRFASKRYGGSDFMLPNGPPILVSQHHASNNLRGGPARSTTTKMIRTRVFRCHTLPRSQNTYTYTYTNTFSAPTTA